MPLPIVTIFAMIVRIYFKPRIVDEISWCFARFSHSPPGTGRRIKTSHHEVSDRRELEVTMVADDVGSQKPDRTGGGEAEIFHQSRCCGN